MKKMKDPFREAQDAAIAAANDDWKSMYTFFALDFLTHLKKGDVFSGDQVNMYVQAQIGEREIKPAYQALGAMFGKTIRPLIESGLVEVDGFARSVRASNHGHYYRTYRRAR